jgi:hypothetical protein
MLRIGVKSSIDQALAAISAFDSEQLPFAASKALNDTAYAAQKAVRAAMPSEFTIRRDWVVQQVKVMPSRKADLVATIYDDNDFMVRQEYGGEKMSIDGKAMIAVPLRSAFPLKSIVPNDLRPRNLPNTLRGVGGQMTARVTIKDGRQFLARLMPGGGTKGNRLEFLYRLMPSAQVKPRLNLRAITQRVVSERFGEFMSKALAMAMATRRKGGALKDE